MNSTYPLTEDDEVQRLGARWDPERRIWFIPDGVDAEPFAKWRVMDDRTTLTLEQLDRGRIGSLGAIQNSR